MIISFNSLWSLLSTIVNYDNSLTFPGASSARALFPRASFPGAKFLEPLIPEPLTIFNINIFFFKETANAEEEMDAESAENALASLSLQGRTSNESKDIVKKKKKKNKKK